jgi:septum formation protein
MLILASASPRRLELLNRIGISPDLVVPADIDETEKPQESSKNYAARVAFEKACLVATVYPNDYVLAADTVVSVGSRILPKAETEEQARYCLQLLSGRNHKVTTAIALAHKGKIAKRTVVTKLAFKKLSTREIETYIESQEWQGKAGGYGIQGRAGAFVIQLMGSWESVMGLPLYETQSLLQGMGFKP